MICHSLSPGKNGSSSLCTKKPHKTYIILEITLSSINWLRYSYLFESYIHNRYALGTNPTYNISLSSVSND